MTPSLTRLTVGTSGSGSHAGLGQDEEGLLEPLFEVSVDAADDVIGELALSDPNVQRFVANKTVRKTIIVPGRLVNIVV